MRREVGSANAIRAILGFDGIWRPGASRCDSGEVSAVFPIVGHDFLARNRIHSGLNCVVALVQSPRADGWSKALDHCAVAIAFGNGGVVGLCFAGFRRWSLDDPRSVADSNLVPQFYQRQTKAP